MQRAPSLVRDQPANASVLFVRDLWLKWHLVVLIWCTHVLILEFQSSSVDESKATRWGNKDLVWNWKLKTTKADYYLYILHRLFGSKLLTGNGVYWKYKGKVLVMVEASHKASNYITSNWQQKTH